MTYYWGVPDTSIVFCEDKYVKSQYISEFYNTISGLFYIFVSLPFLNTNINDLAYINIFLGIGTITLHMTQRYYGQIMDEMAMITLGYFILNKLNNRYKKKIIIVLLFLYLQNHKNFTIFFSIFFSIILLIIYESRNVKKVKSKFYRNLFIFCMFLGLIFWTADQKMCYLVKNYQLHFFWHLTTSIAIYCGFTLLKDE